MIRRETVERTIGHGPWSAPSSIPSLGPREIHIWRADLSFAHGRRQSLLGSMLDEHELARAGRFHRNRHREWFIARRAILRTMLGHYVETPPAKIRFEHNRWGKPRLAGDAAAGIGLRFSLSHSHGRMLIAVARGREIGVDLERIAAERADPGVAQKFFAPGERAALRQLTGESWLLGFFDCWTRKEAYVKATGKGLSIPLDSFEVSIAADRPALVSVDGSHAGTRWCMKGVRPWNGFVGAVVAEGESGSMNFRLLSLDEVDLCFVGSVVQHAGGPGE